MQYRIKARARPVVAAMAFAALAFVPGAVSAQMVFFSGYTNGCFNCAAPAPNAGYQGDVVGPGAGSLGYVNSQFSGTTVGGNLSIGNGASAPAVQNVDNFGSFYLTSNPYNYVGNSFTLLISFVNPSNHSELFTTALTGQVLGSQLGGVYMNFDNSPRFWSNGSWSYSVAINDVDLTSPQAGGPGYFAAPITGRVTAQAAAVPEPISMILMGTGIVGLGIARRRRQQVQEADLV